MVWRLIVLGTYAWAALAQSSPLQQALVLFNSGKYGEALQIASSYSVQHPESGAALKLIGMSQFMLGNPEDALTSFRHAVQVAPRDADAYYYLGRLYFSKDNAVDALSCFQKALELDPASIRARNNLGQAYEALARFDEAEQAYLTAIAAEQQQPRKSEWPAYNLGLLYLNKGKTSEAISYLRAAVERNPQFALGKMKLAIALSKQGEIDEPLALLHQAATLEPDNPEAHYRLGQLLTKLGKTREADEHLARFNQLKKR